MNAKLDRPRGPKQKPRVALDAKFARDVLDSLEHLLQWNIDEKMREGVEKEVVILKDAIRNSRP